MPSRLSLGANLVSTIAGTVASVSIAPGDSVTAGSGSSRPQIVVIGTGSSYEVTTDIAVADIGKVAVGSAGPDHSGLHQHRRRGPGVLDRSAGHQRSTTTTYPVTIALESTGLGSCPGPTPTCAIVVKKSVDVTTVPSSAVRTVGSIHW